jgi:hypothetical protein
MIDLLRHTLRDLTHTATDSNEMDLTPWKGRKATPSPRGDWSLSVELDGPQRCAIFRITAFTILPFPEPSALQAQQLRDLGNLPGTLELHPDSGEVALLHEEHWTEQLPTSQEAGALARFAAVIVQRGQDRVRIIGGSWERVVRPLTIPPQPIGSC